MFSRDLLTRRWIWLLAAIFGLRLILMGTMPMADTSEPRYAEIARLMASTGDWITPWFEPGVPFWGKPPLAFWASALSFRWFGNTDLAARLPAWLATLAVVALLYSYARERFDTERAKLATLIYSTSLLPFALAGAVLTDAYLTLAITLGLVAVAKQLPARRLGWGYAFFISLALGMLSKGPLALVLMLAVLMPWLLWQRQAAWQSIKRLPWAGGMLLFLALSLPWYILAEIKTPGFLQYFIVGEHFYRFVDPGWQGDLYGSAHQRVYGAIWFDWLLATLPWGPYAVWCMLRGIRHTARPWRALAQMSPDSSLLLWWALATPAFFTLSGNILWTYVLPSLPAFALLLAGHLQTASHQAPVRVRWPALLAPVPAVAIVLGAAVFIEPDLLKTERDLIAVQQAHATAGQPLYYLDGMPFSARYYSRNQAQALNDGISENLLATHPAGVFLAVRNDAIPASGLPANAAKVYKNRRYTLFYTQGRTAYTAPTTRFEAQPS